MTDTKTAPAGLANGGDNPFLQPWTGPFGVPPFDRIKPEHFAPAYARAFAEHEAEIERDRRQSGRRPRFENTIVGAGEQRPDARSGWMTCSTQLVGTDSNDALLAIERDISPVAAAHWNQIRMNEALFAAHRCAASGPRRRSGSRRSSCACSTAITPRTGAAAPRSTPSEKERLAEIAERLAVLGTAFSQNVLADEQSYALVLDGEADLAGLPDFVRAAARAAAEERGQPGKHVITLSRSSVEPFLQFSRGATCARRRSAPGSPAATATARPTTRRSSPRPSRCAASAPSCSATRPSRITGSTTRWRRRRRRCAGFSKRSGRRRAMRALADRDAMQEMVAEEGGNFALAPWDWRYYAEKLRKIRCDLDEAAVKPYMQLDRIIEAAFYTAQPAVRPDLHARRCAGLASRRAGLGGARRRRQPRRHLLRRLFRAPSQAQRRLDEHAARPGEVPRQRPPAGRQRDELQQGRADAAVSSTTRARCSTSSATRLHGLLSDVTYPPVSGTSVLTDWVELPSQLYEHWFEQPEVLRKFARHVETGEPIPEDAAEEADRGADLRPRLRDAGIHFVGASSISTCICWNRPTGSTSTRSRRETLERIGMPAEIVMRHRPPHFAHVFSGGYYASAYYSYMWSEVLDADAFRRSRRPATSSIRRWRASSSRTCSRPAARAIRPSSTSHSAAACRTQTRLAEEARLRRRGLA